MIVYICCYLGGLLTLALFLKIKSYRYDKKGYYIPYNNLLDCVTNDKLVFQKRIQNTVYFTGYENMDIMYDIKQKDVSGFIGNKCVLVPSPKIADIMSKIISGIERKFYKEIYMDIITINDIVYSNNLIYNKETENEPINVNNRYEILLEDDVIDETLIIDDIIKKIKDLGMNSLNQREKDFINDIKNWHI